MGLLSRILRRREPVLIWFGPDATVAEAIAVMAEKEIGIVPILEDGALLGVFSERDLLRRVVAKGLSIDLTKLREVMTPDPVTATAHDARDVAILKMRVRGCRHLPILDGDTVVDMVSIRDILHDEIQDREEEIRNLQDYIQYGGGMQAGGAS